MLKAREHEQRVLRCLSHPHQRSHPLPRLPVKVGDTSGELLSVAGASAVVEDRPVAIEQPHGNSSVSVAVVAAGSPDAWGCWD